MSDWKKENDRHAVRLMHELFELERCINQLVTENYHSNPDRLIERQKLHKRWTEIQHLLHAWHRGEHILIAKLALSDVHE